MGRMSISPRLYVSCRGSTSGCSPNAYRIRRKWIRPARLSLSTATVARPIGVRPTALSRMKQWHRHTGYGINCYCFNRFMRIASLTGKGEIVSNSQTARLAWIMCSTANDCAEYLAGQRQYSPYPAARSVTSRRNAPGTYFSVMIGEMHAELIHHVV